MRTVNRIREYLEAQAKVKAEQAAEWERMRQMGKARQAKYREKKAQEATALTTLAS